MENASYALLIAGGILFAILTITLLAAMFNNLSTMQNAKADVERTQELAEWNEQWEAYNGRYLYGTDVLTLINKAEQNNIDYNSSEYEIIIKVNNGDGTNITLDNTGFLYEGTGAGSSTKQAFLQQHRNTIYQCEIQYNPNGNGRVYKIEIDVAD